MSIAKLTAISLFFASPFAMGSTAAQCDITTLPCWDGGKCNIKFKNHTGEGTGDSTDDLSQTSSAMDIQIKAVDANGKKTGNSFKIIAGASKTMNLEKKYNKGFNEIRLIPVNNYKPDRATMSCQDVKKVLRGNGNCNVFFGYGKGQGGMGLGFSCDNGRVTGPGTGID